ncbi:MAG: type II toxin-antitoxin system ParD family antitoxin [Pirellulales bacterium]|nr:type II toxin-antitoxin system ParD family antitoxin [Pirellulales bacterium]
MSTDLTPENEQFVQETIARGIFRSREEALNTAVVLLREREDVIRAVNAGIEQVERGEVRPFDREKLRAEIRQLVADEKTEH